MGLHWLDAKSRKFNTEARLSPPAPLFRPEVMQASQTQWLGSIRISRPPWFGWVTLIALTLAITLVVFSVWGQVTRKAKLPGVLIPQEGLIQVAAPQTGLVSELLVQEGQQVEVGQVLLRISSQLHNQTVNAYGKTQALKAGMALKADVIQDRRAVWEWVMEPVLAAHKQVKVLNADPVGRREGV